MANENLNGSGPAAPEWLRSSVQTLETNAGLDPAADVLASVAGAVAAGPRGDLLRGRWLGHALHPLLTDFPLGCWLSAGLLDLVGGRRSRRAARRLIGLGLLFSAPTAAAGLADWSTARADDARVRRVGVVHGVGNMVVAMLYLRSWRSRRRGRHLRGMAWGMAGGTLAWGTGWLGGHMALAYGAGDGTRGLSSAPPPGGTANGPSSGSEAPTAATSGHGTPGGGPLGAATATGTGPAGSASGVPAGADDDQLLDLRQASERLGVQPEQVRAMVDQGLLSTVAGNRFRPSEVEAVRLQGG